MTTPESQYLERRLTMLDERVRTLEEQVRKSDLRYSTIKDILKFVVLPTAIALLLLLVFSLGMDAGKADAEKAFNEKQAPQQPAE